MLHDGLTGPNVMTGRTALHGITPERLEKAADRWRGQLAPAGAPTLGILLGGDNAAYRLTDGVIDNLLSLLRRANAAAGYCAMITPSRRTSEAVKRRLDAALSSEPWATIWDGSGENPYLGILALADRLIVTSDSISMISEALAAGAPVHVLPLEGHGERHGAFLQDIMAAELVSQIRAGELDWRFPGGGRLNSTPDVGRRIRDMLGQTS
jgi:mitochondrial fission protein ELM1